jgi:predicted enzyme related to lactoylglutathione lyase
VKLHHNLFCRDIDAQLDFYCRMLDAQEAVHLRSPIYRAIGFPGFQLGFHAHAAYDLLRLGDRAPRDPGPPPVTGYPTLMLATPAAVTERAERVPQLGGRVVKAPYATYYGQWQAVLDDPEGHVFRLSCDALPDGVTAPALHLDATPAQP